LRDPAGYFRRLRGAAPGLWIVAEKILQPGETLAEDWQVDGTTGYDFLNVAGGLFVDPNAESLLSGVHAEFVGPAADIDFASSVLESKRLVLDDLLAAELWRLTRIFQKICASKRRHRDFANEELRRALREVIASLPVYRSYFQPGSGYREREASYVRSAVADARLQRPELDSELLTLLQELLCGGCDSELEWEFVGRFQQVSAATMAKGFEDTACYRNARLVSLNEVGGDPSKFGRETSEFHAFCGAISSRWPTTLVATTTHDTKRSEDARLRVSALSEFAPEWAQAVNEWSRAVHAGFHGDPPDRSTEYLIWQTLVASYPISEQRLCVYLQKAIRESKLVTSWSNQNARYEASVLDFARSVLSNPGVLQSVGEFVGQLLPVAWRSSLSQTLLKLTACGVPDIYQGSELWDTRLTDPDNRGPVDFDEHRRLLEVATRASSEDALAGFEQGLPKLWLLQRVLGLRRFKPDWFGPSAGYRPLQPLGPDADRVVAFARGEHLVAVAPRLWRRLLSTGFADTELVLPAGSYRNLFDSDVRYSGKVALGAMLRRFPVALLLAERSA
jgi:(1->4)-alpha-D-glucan 1-alpha-D-glucosylmutase